MVFPLLIDGERFTSEEEVLKKIRDFDLQEDPISNPFKSKYEAREILIKVREAVEAELTSHKHSSPSSLQVSLARFLYELGLNYSFCEEFFAAEKCFTESKRIFSSLEKSGEASESKDGKATGFFSVESVDVNNQLGILWCNRGEYERSKALLVEAQRQYRSRVEDDDEKEITGEIANLHTLTLFYLAQVYARLENSLLSSIYCHLCLVRQLALLKAERNKSGFNASEWIENVIGLSQYYYQKKKFSQAKHCLDAATHCISFFKERKIEEENNEKEKGEGKEHGKERKEATPMNPLFSCSCPSEERLSRFEGDHARTEGLFYLRILNVSKGRLENSNEEDEEDEEEQQSDESAGEQEKQKDEFLISDEEKRFALEEIRENCPSFSSASSISSFGSDSFLILFDELNLPPPPSFPLFSSFSENIPYYKTCINWLHVAQKLFPLDGFVSDYVPLVLLESSAIAALSFWEEDTSRKAKLNKRRLDLLEPVMTQLSLSAYLPLVQQLAAEVGLLYYDQVDLKQGAITEEEKKGLKANDKAQKKLNELALKGAQALKLWCRTWQESISAPSVFSVSYSPPVASPSPSSSSSSSSLSSPSASPSSLPPRPAFPPLRADLLDPDNRPYRCNYASYLFKLAYFYSRIYVEDVELLNLNIFQCIIFLEEFLNKAKQWPDAVQHLAVQIDVAKQMLELLPLKMERVRIVGPFK